MFLDLDYTFLVESSEPKFLFACVKKGIINVWDFLRVIPLYFIKVFKYGPYDAFLRMKEIYKGKDEQKLREVAKELAPKLKVNKKVRDIVETYRNRGFKIVLLSGSMSWIVEEVAKLYGFIPVATEVDLKTGKLLQYPYKEGKLKIAKKICNNLKKCAAFGDSYADRFLLDAVGEPFAVNPKGKMRKYALKRNYIIVEGKVVDLGEEEHGSE